jgi:hypothetical protein
MAEIVINDQNWHATAIAPPGAAKGCIPRDYSVQPHRTYGSVTGVDFPLIPRAEWPDRIADLERSKSRLSDIRGDIPSRDQNGKGYCWAHSSTSALLLLRAVQGEPYADLSAYAIACIIKQYQDEGGWGALSMDWVCQNGCPTAQFWPQQSMSRSNDNPAMRENAKLHRVTEGWWDAGAQPYDRALTFDQMATCLLLRIPVVVDMNWWGHSICAVDLVSPTSIRIWNSWGDSWSERGMGVLEGQKAVPDGAVAPLVTMASTN